ncbi:hypothetical protein DFH09DRAFT_1488762 [Mycena vulgaris]|nr:hypothetical protein DFH09DRAFT_1488762 [Mycena vulgaris]
MSVVDGWSQQHSSGNLSRLKHGRRIDTSHAFQSLPNTKTHSCIMWARINIWNLPRPRFYPVLPFPVVEAFICFRWTHIPDHLLTSRTDPGTDGQWRRSPSPWPPRRHHRRHPADWHAFHTGGKLSSERLELVAELSASSAALGTVTQLMSKLTLDPSSVHHQQLVQHLYADIESCRGLSRRFHDRLTAAHSPLQHISMVFSHQRGLTKFRTKLMRHQESLRTWQTTLILVSAQKISIGVQRLGSRVKHVGHDLRGLDLASSQEISTNVERLGSRVKHVGRDLSLASSREISNHVQLLGSWVEDYLRCLGRHLSVYHEMVLNVPRGVVDDMIFITDYIGGKIYVLHSESIARYLRWR